MTPFLAAQAADPFDPAPMLIHADWLEEAGDQVGAAILDAEPGDDAPALIACDHLEGLGVEGKIWDQSGPLPDDWNSKIHWPVGPDGGGPEAPWSWIHRGPLASWCRHLIATRCVACGGWRDGEDWIDTTAVHTFQAGESLELEIGVFLARGRTVSEVKRKECRHVFLRTTGGEKRQFGPAPCPLCGFPAHPTPPPLAIPEVVKG